MEEPWGYRPWWLKLLITCGGTAVLSVIAIIFLYYFPPDISEKSGRASKAERFAARAAEQDVQRTEQIEDLKLQVAVARGEAGTAEQLEYSGFADEPAWVRTIRQASLETTPACAANERFRSADIVRRKTLAAPLPLKFAPHEIGMTKAEVIGLHRRTAADAATKLIGLLDHPAAGKRCRLDAPAVIANRIVDILLASKLAPKDIGLSEKHIAWKIRAALAKE